MQVPTDLHVYPVDAIVDKIAPESLPEKEVLRRLNYFYLKFLVAQAKSSKEFMADKI